MTDYTNPDVHITQQTKANIKVTKINKAIAFLMQKQTPNYTHSLHKIFMISVFLRSEN